MEYSIARNRLQHKVSVLPTPPVQDSEQVQAVLADLAVQSVVQWLHELHFVSETQQGAVQCTGSNWLTVTL
jgi:hypothetical protein